MVIVTKDNGRGRGGGLGKLGLIKTMKINTLKFENQTESCFQRVLLGSSLKENSILK
jgi:hypothetical protein